MPVGDINQLLISIFMRPRHVEGNPNSGTPFQVYGLFVARQANAVDFEWFGLMVQSRGNRPFLQPIVV